MYYLKNLRFTVPYTKEVISFNDGEVPGFYEILNWQRASDGGVAYARVGHYNSTAPVGERLAIINSSIIWHNDMLQVGEILQERKERSCPCVIEV